MTIESASWFIGQGVVAGLAVLVGLWFGRQRASLWRGAGVVAVLMTLCWPLIRIWPVRAIAVVPLSVLVFVEITGIVVPVVFLFTVAARHLRHRSERRATWLLVAVCGVYFVRHGMWMVAPPVPEMRMARYVDGVCRQSTGYTCVAASLVTQLGFHGIDANETEMARLSYTMVDAGTTDLRAMYALEQKLAGSSLAARYERMDYDRLRAVPMPCLVAIDWGYFSSHMVPVLAVNEEGVVLGDPLTGPRTMARAAFEREWHRRGIYLK
jgi:predicted double-glycine peptidase